MQKEVVSNKGKLGESKILTKRELQCLVFLSEGLNAKEVARNMFISDETVSSHKRSIRRKLNCRNITQAVTQAYNNGLLQIKNVPSQ